MTSLLKSNIAIVDDDFRILQALEALLESEGYSVFSFPSAQALLQDTVLPEIDCLIADIGMPVIDGFELRRRARAEQPELPVIFMTARHEATDQRRAAAGGHQGFFRKPFDAQDLLTAVSRAVLKQPPEC